MLLNGVVIGSSVEAAYYSLVNDLFFIPTRKISPMFYEHSPVQILGLTKKSEIWTKINLMLGLLSKRINFGDESSIRVVGNVIRITSENVTFKYQFEGLYIFDSTGVQLENEIETATMEECRKRKCCNADMVRQTNIRSVREYYYGR